MSTREAFDNQAQGYLTKIASDLTRVAREELTKLAEQFPTRRVFFRESMGTADIYVEVFSDSWINKRERFELVGTGATVVGITNMDEHSQMGIYGNLFADFHDLLSWINDQSDTYRVTCDDIDIEATEERKRNA